MRNLIDVLPAREMQASINDAEFAALEPQQPMTIPMRHARRVETQPPLQHLAPAINRR
ncbi:hypothetical protein P9239_04155 [Caballeronia sp. LZ062]|uniref:hypothetical protein n=1 Tax=unclassified Caballeronia TaxID=2646786 RepID=UPI002863D90D|nr:MULTISPECIES: hypothetical protein [unclassified Caballeronia]MDR5869550.1 hypothetical protein [Caballeronia sp. LZ062]